MNGSIPPAYDPRFQPGSHLPGAYGYSSPPEGQSPPPARLPQDPGGGPPKPPSPEPRKGFATLVRIAIVLYGLALLGLVLCVYGVGERLWVSTVFLFSPRWLVAGMGLALAMTALIVRARWWALAVVVGLVVLSGPLFGFNVPLRGLASGSGGEPTIRVLVWNVQSGNVGMDEVERLLEAEKPDVAVFTECRDFDREFPAGWNKHLEEQHCFLSRLPIVEVVSRDRTDVWARDGSGVIVRYVVETKAGPIALTGVHLETPRTGLEAFTKGHVRSGAEQLAKTYVQREWEHGLADEWSRGGKPSAGKNLPRLVAGDFNTPPESDLFRIHWQGYRNCFSEVGLGAGNTKHARIIGVRIDHVLASPEWRCVSARVAVGKGSDHSPLVAELRLDGP